LVTIGAIPTGSNTIGAVTQASGPWTTNLTQFGGSAVATGTGASGAGVPRVTISNDSSLAANQSVNISQVNGVTTLTGAGATGTGSQRETVAQDTTTIAGSAPGTAGSPSTNVVSIQGVSSGTTVPVSGTVSNNNAVNVTLTDCSGTVATGGTAVNAFTAQTTLHGFTILNTNTSEVMWISFTTTAAASTAGSYPLAAGATTTFAGAGSFTSPPGMGTNHALSVVAATSAHAFSCTWW
jgi:hypothetical protein